MKKQKHNDIKDRFKRNVKRLYVCYPRYLSEIVDYAIRNSLNDKTFLEIINYFFFPNNIINFALINNFNIPYSYSEFMKNIDMVLTYLAIYIEQKIISPAKEIVSNLDDKDVLKILDRVGTDYIIYNLIIDLISPPEQIFVKLCYISNGKFDEYFGEIYDLYSKYRFYEFRDIYPEYIFIYWAVMYKYAKRGEDN